MAKSQETIRILRRLLAEGMTARAERLLTRMRPADRGPVLSGLTPPEVRTVMDLLFEKRRAASTLKELPPEIKTAQRTFFALLYHLLVGRDTGPRLPTLLLAVGQERVRSLLGA